MEALSGRVQPTKVASTPDKQEDAPAVKERITAEELRDFLMKIDSTPAEAFLATNEEEICSQADMFVNNTHEIAKAKNRALRDTPGSKNTHPDKNLPGATPNSDASTTEEESEKGVLAAEAILSTSVLSPTGTQTVSMLNIDAHTIDKFAGLREFTPSKTHQKLAELCAQFQEAYGRRNSWNNSPCYNGYYALIDPLLLSSYVPYIDAVVDLKESQAIDCFHCFSEVDGYPTIGGVPVWERQEWERIEYYNLFKLYRDMRYAFYNESDMLLTTRSLQVLSKAVHLAPRTLLYLASVYEWSFRVDLYDAWMSAQQERRVAVKRSLMLDRHSKISQSLIQKAYVSLSRQADKLSAKDALEMLKLGLTYERISLGLIGDKPSDMTTPQQQPLISVVNQTNNNTGLTQINNSAPAERLQDNMKRPDTLLSVLSVLQRSGAFDTLLQKAAASQSPDGDADYVVESDEVPQVEEVPTDD